jgi:hypothetical protein
MDSLPVWAFDVPYISWYFICSVMFSCGETLFSIDSNYCDREEISVVGLLADHI